MSSFSGDDSDSDSVSVGNGDGDSVFDLLPSTISCLNSATDPSARLAVLTSLCQALAFTQYEEELADLPLDEIVPLLVKLAGKGNQDASPDVMLMSSRALTYMIDLIPRSASVFVKHGAVEVLCAPLLGIEYLDIAEQCLEALEKLSRSQSVACLKAGAMMLVLSIIDFFELNIQRVAVSIATNMCKEIPENYVSAVMDVVPTLCHLLENQDRKIVESASTCLMRIVENVDHSTELLDVLCKHGVVKQSVKLISPVGQRAISEATYSSMIGLLAQFSTCSLVAVRTLYESDICITLGTILKSSDLSRCFPNPHCDNSSRDQVHVTLKLLNQLIPPVSSDDQDIQLVLGKESILINESKFLLQFAEDILPTLIQAVNSGANTCICFGCVSVLKSFVSLVTPAMLREFIQNTDMSRFLARLLSREEHHVLIPALNMVEILMKKLPDEYLISFFKEGVIYAIRALSNQSSQIWDSENQTAADLSSCLCYAFYAPKRPSSSESKSCRLQRHTLGPLATHILFTFFTDSLISNMGLSENLQKLKACCAAGYNNEDSEEYFSQTLDEVMMKLNGGDSMSTFEFIESGLLSFLAHYLTCENRALDGDKNPDAYLAVLKRLRFLTCRLLSVQSWNLLPLKLLVQHLLNALSALECFPVILSSGYVPISSRTDIPAKCSTMHPCLQVHFVKEEGETDLRPYDSVLTIEFSSSYDAIEGFLWPKVHKKKAITKGARSHRKQSSPEEDSKQQVENLSSQSSNDNITTKLIFLLNGKQLDRSMTLFQAVLQAKINDDSDSFVSNEFWNQVHMVTFKKEKEPQPVSPQQPSLSNFSFFSSILPVNLKLERSNPSYDTIYILSVLEGLNRCSFHFLSYERSNAFAEGRIDNFDDLKVMLPSLPQSEFISSKLTDKLEQQMQDPLALSTATMPLWCSQLVVACPFLFSFGSRFKYFRLNTLVSLRHQTQYVEKEEIINERRPGSDPLPRKRFKVHRDNILGSAAKMMTWYGSKKALLEIEFSKEVGTGLGPTLEFYTLVSQELQKVGMGMWRGDQRSGKVKNSNYLAAPFGLFPRPWSDCTDSLSGTRFSKVLKNFFLIGQLIARAIQDRRILDLPFSVAFYKLILEQDLNICDIQSFDPEFGRTLVEFQALVKRKRFLDSESGENSMCTSDLSYRDARVEDLCLDFALPGYSDYIFASKSNSNIVNMSNLEEYVSVVVDATVRSGISRQMESFKSGFNKVFPIKALQMFTAEELERILCGEQDTWDLHELQNNIKFDHGYACNSLCATRFLEIIEGFEPRQRRAFLLFVTGAPRLPRGGLAALKPNLTVVRKHCSGDVDMELPSVMTCANYLKLPPYSSKVLMKEKLLYAIMEGQRAFHLS